MAKKALAVDGEKAATVAVISGAGELGLWAHCCSHCGAGWHWGGFQRCPECGRDGHSLRAEDWRRTDAYRLKHGEGGAP